MNDPKPLKQGRARSDWADMAHPKREKPRRGAAARYQERMGKTDEKLDFHQPEVMLQAFAEDYCANTGLDCFHIPEIMLDVCFDPRRRVGGPDEAEDLRDAGEQIKAWPDCFIMDPEFPWQFLPLELKKLLGTLTRRQRDRHQAMQTLVPRTQREIVDIIEAWRARLRAVGVCRPVDLQHLKPKTPNSHFLGK